MSTLKVNNIKDASGGTANLKIDGAAKAWANFNGAGTPAIRDSFNISSITDNNTGDYTVNFTTDMDNANYCFQLSATDDGSTSGQTDGYTYGGWKRNSDSVNHTISGARFKLGYTANDVYYDQTHVMVTIFGD